MSDADAATPDTALTLLKSSEYLTTCCGSLDQLLRGGLTSNGITEICGPSSSGKTHFCFQLCCTVQLPQSIGGLNGSACYITNDFSVHTERLQDIGQYVASRQEYESFTSFYQVSCSCRLSFLFVMEVEWNFSDNVYILLGTTAQMLLASLEHHLPELIKKNAVKLLVIDSLAGSMP